MPGPTKTMTDDDYAASPPAAAGLSLSPATTWGGAALLLGCTLLLAACVLLVFNVILFSNGLNNIPQNEARTGGLVGTIAVAALGLFAVGCGVRGWAAASSAGESRGLGVAGTVVATVGLVGWLIAGIDLLAILRLFA